MKEQQQKNENNYMKIIGLSKQINGFNIINNFNLKLFPDDIFCLLGLNEKEKACLIEMILGLITPEEGDVFLYGESLLKNKNIIYDNIRFCPNENIFYEDLAIKENLEFIYNLKGAQPDDSEINKLISYLNLDPLKDSNLLSKEDQRLVNFALSIIEGKKVIILDEPTKQIIKQSKKNLIWDYLKNNQKDKIILVFTNSFQEVEYLANKIGIMKNGNLICSGDINDIKLKYINEIKIKLLIDPNILDENDKARIFGSIKEYNSKAEMKILSNKIILIILKDNKNMSLIIKFLEENLTNSIIKDYQIDNYSLEEVFKKEKNLSNLKENEDNLFIKNIQ